MTRSFVQRAALVLAAAVGLLGTRPATANAQKALVYCPVNVDATGCNTIVNALTGPTFPLGVDRGYDGTGGTVNLETVDLFSYSVFVVPSLADGSGSQPYAKLRDPEVVEHLKAALIGRIAMWSGTPDQGATNRAMKDALIQNLAGWAAGAYATAKGPGLVTLLDASASAVSRYDWVRAIAPLPVTSDANLLIYNSVRALNPQATAILTSGAGPIAYTNMATYGFQVPNGAAGVSLDAVGQTGTAVGGQVVLLTMEAGNSAGATVMTDKDDYAPGQTVTITGTGWQAGEQVKLTLHMDPLRDADTELTATANGSGAFVNTDFAPADYDLGVRFVLTAVGQSSGKRAQTTFTDGNKISFALTATGAEISTFGSAAVNQCVDAFVQERQGSNIDNGNHPARLVNLASAPPPSATFYAGAGCAGSPVSSVTIAANTPHIAFSFRIGATGSFTVSGTNANLSGSNNASATISIGAAPPTASNDSYSTNEDQSLTVPASGVLTNDTGTAPITATLQTNVPAAAGSVTLNANGGFTYTPALNFNGSTSFTYTAQNAGGSSNVATVSITVNSVNDAPSFLKGADQTVLEDAAAQTVTGWATAIVVGPSNESAQTIAFNVSNTNNALFSAQPAIAPNGTLTYTPTANAFGTATVTVTATDNGGTANGGIDTSGPQTFTITVTGVNDEPSFVKGADQAVDEDAAAQSISSWATAISAGPNEIQTLTFTVGNDNAALFSVQPSVSSTGTLTYTVAPNVSGVANLTIFLKDDGGTANGGDDTSPTQTFKITVNPVNDTPTFTKGADETVLEDSGPRTAAGWATAVSAGAPDEAGQTLTFNVLATNTGLFSVQPAIAPNGTLTYTPEANQYGSTTVTVTLSDNGTPVATSAPQTFTINITAVNDEPSFTKGGDQTVNEDAGAQTITPWATGINPGPNEGGQTVSFTVTNDNNALFAVQPAVSPTGTLTYTPAADAFGTATVTLFIKDNGGTANGGDDESATQTFTITVNSVNDTPSFTKGADDTVLEDSGPRTVAGWATAISAGPANESGQTLTFNVSATNTALFSVQPAIAPNGTLTYSPEANQYGSTTVTVTLSDNGTPVATSAQQTFTITITPVNDEPSFTKGADQTVNEDAGAVSVPGWATAINAGPNEGSQVVDFQVSNNNNTLFSTQPAVAPNGTLTFTPAANAHGVATVTIRIHDDGGTANGGDDTGVDQTFTITVNSVNDAPSFVKGADQTVLEDATAQTIGGWATAISEGPADEETQVLTFTVTNTNNALFSAQPAIAPDGTLTYTPAANQYGSATVTVFLKDDGGIANGGDDTSDSQTFTITITPVNDEPSFTKGANQTVNEDAGAQTVTPWAPAISAGPNEASQTVSFTVSNDNNALFSTQPAVSPTGELTYTPAANAFGTATVTLFIKDNGGTANGGDDESPTQTFTITVNSVNDAPSFVKGADQTVLEDAVAQTVAGWATSISAGPANESGQLLTFSALNSNNALFSVQPAIAPNGTLTYTPAANRFGTATVTVTLSDDGSTANGGDDTSDPQTFTITITPVNDAPSFTKGGDQTVNEDSGPHTVSGWASAISAGPFETQALTFQVSSDNPSLFATGPAISASGDLTYSLAPNANGGANVTVTLKDDGGTLNDGIDTSAPQTFTITVNPVNDVPSFTKGADQTVLEDTGPHSVTGWATAISVGPANESSQTLAFTVTNDNNAIFSVQPAIAPNGTLTYTLAANRYGSANVTVVLKDDGGTANGGDDTSDPQMFVINVTPVNDEPSFTKGADQTVLEDAVAQTVGGWATAISPGPFETQALTFTVSNDNNALFSAQPALAADGTLTYTVAPNAFGSATVSVFLKDDGGIANGGDDTSPTETFTITVTPVNDAPTFVKGADQTVLEDAAAQTVAGWATSIIAGPANESGQTLAFTTSSTNPSLFSVAPAIDATTGTLTYTLAANANGSATVTVTLKDNGGTANGGVDQSQQTFVVTVTAVNDTPSFAKGADQTVLEDAGVQTVANWATTISAGPADEASQTLTFGVANNNPTLFSVQPAIAANGTLTYTPAPNANGSATVTVTLSDNGGTADGGDDTSDPQTFTITVTAVNDAPTYDLIPSTTSAEDAPAQTVAGAATAMSAGPADEASQTLTFSVANNNNALFSAQPTIAADGTLTYTAAPNANGTATVTVTLMDNGGTANGGINQTTKTFTITITKVNDAPVITAFSGPIAPNAVNTPITVTGNFTDVDLGDMPMTELHTVTINWGDATPTTAPSLTGSGITRNLSANHTYANAGVYTVTLTVKDAGNLTDVETYQYVVVYDPNAGFVTGGGWINSPTGAYVANPSLTGKATFGFVSKYKKGQSQPDGNTEFQFHAAGMNFKSSVYEWLVIAGAKSQFKGTGTIDGAGNYGFMLTAIDGQLSGGGGADKFRIKIWDKNNGDAVVYDNQILSADDANPTTLLGGGSINIQAK